MWSLAFPFGLGRTGMGITRSKEDTVLYVSNSKMRFSTKSAVLNWNRVSVQYRVILNSFTKVKTLEYLINFIPVYEI